MQEWVKASGSQGLHRVRGTRQRGQGRHDQGHHRAGEPPGLPRRGAAEPDRAGEVADVRAALRAPPARRRRGRDLRSQLVQPRRGRARDGVLHAGADRAVPRAGARRSRRRWSTPASCSSSTGSRSARTEQTLRLQSRIDDPRKIWKLSDMDLKSYSRWYDYARARDDMFAATDTAWAPWHVVRTDDKRRGRLNLITHLLSQVPVRAAQAQEGHAPRSPEARRLRRARPRVP